MPKKMEEQPGTTQTRETNGVFGGLHMSRLKNGECVLDSNPHSGHNMIQLTEDIDYLRNKGTKAVTIYINCVGGYVHEGLQVIAAIRKLQKNGTKVTGRVRGFALSMGFFILEACDERVAGPGDILMAHGISGGVFGDDKAFKAEQKLMDYWRGYFNSYIVKRVQEADPKSKAARPAYWTPLLKDDTSVYYTSKEAVALGLIDRVEE